MGELFYDLGVMNKALNAGMIRHNVITNNITNQETPGYKRQDVKFETLLQQQIQEKGSNKINLQTLEPEVYTDKASFMGRMDGNNVDIDKEMTELAKNKLRYETLTRSASFQIQRFKYILQNIR